MKGQCRKWWVGMSQSRGGGGRNEKSPYAHTYIYDGNTHDSQPSMLLLLLLSKALLACKTCVYMANESEREKKCVWLSIGMRVKLKKIHQPPIVSMYKYIYICSLIVGWIIRSFFVLRFFSSPHTSYLTTDHHPISSHTAHRGKKKKFSLKNNKNEKKSLKPPHHARRVWVRVCMCVLWVFTAPIQS